MNRRGQAPTGNSPNRPARCFPVFRNNRFPRGLATFALIVCSDSADRVALRLTAVSAPIGIYCPPWRNLRKCVCTRRHRLRPGTPPVRGSRRLRTFPAASERRQIGQRPQRSQTRLNAAKSTLNEAERGEIETERG